MKHIQNCLSGLFVLVCTQERYCGGFSAYLGYDNCINELADLITGSDNDWAATLNLKGSDWYPYAIGDTVEEAIANLEKKIAPFVGEDVYNSKWKEYVVLLASRLTDENAHVYIDSRFVFPKFDEIKEEEFHKFIGLFE